MSSQRVLDTVRRKRAEESLSADRLIATIIM